MNKYLVSARTAFRPYVPESIRRVWLQLRATTRLEKEYRKRVGERLNLESPETFNDKIQWLKLYYRNPLYPSLVDKFSVRDYVAELAGSYLLNKCYGVWESPKDIQLDELPNEFVLKTTHGSGHVIVCTDKNALDWQETLEQLTSWLRFRYGEDWYEWPYTQFKPRIIAERLLRDKQWGVPLDYKFFCFDGEPRFVQVDISRYVDHCRNIYDLDWNLLEVSFEYKQSKDQLNPPTKLPEMLEVSRKLAVGKPFCRVDLYEYDSQVQFGELTFFPESGFGRFSPSEWNKTWGDMLTLPVA